MTIDYIVVIELIKENVYNCLIAEKRVDGNVEETVVIAKFLFAYDRDRVWEEAVKISNRLSCNIILPKNWSESGQ